MAMQLRRQRQRARPALPAAGRDQRHADGGRDAGAAGDLHDHGAADDLQRERRPAQGQRRRRSRRRRTRSPSASRPTARCISAMTGWSWATWWPSCRRSRRRQPDRRIFVRGDKTVPYGRMIEVMGTIKQGGFNKVALLVEQTAARLAAPRRHGGADGSARPAPRCPRRKCRAGRWLAAGAAGMRRNTASAGPRFRSCSTWWCAGADVFLASPPPVEPMPEQASFEVDIVGPPQEARKATVSAPMPASTVAPTPSPEPPSPEPPKPTPPQPPPPPRRRHPRHRRRRRRPRRRRPRRRRPPPPQAGARRSPAPQPRAAAAATAPPPPAPPPPTRTRRCRRHRPPVPPPPAPRPPTPTPPSQSTQPNPAQDTGAG